MRLSNQMKVLIAFNFGTTERVKAFLLLGELCGSLDKTTGALDSDSLAYRVPSPSSVRYL